MRLVETATLKTEGTSDVANREGRPTYFAAHTDILQTVAALSDADYAAVRSAFTDYSKRERAFSRPRLIESVGVSARDVADFKPEYAEDLVDALIDLAILNRLESGRARNIAIACSIRRRRVSGRLAPVTHWTNSFLRV